LAGLVDALMLSHQMIFVQSGLGHFLLGSPIAA